MYRRPFSTIHSPKGAERECFAENCFSPLSKAVAISIANLSFASAVRMSELCLMAVLHRTGLGNFENFTRSKSSWKVWPPLSPSWGRSPDRWVSVSAFPLALPGWNWIWNSYWPNRPAYLACLQLRRAFAPKFCTLWWSVYIKNGTPCRYMCHFARHVTIASSSLLPIP